MTNHENLAREIAREHEALRDAALELQVEITRLQKEEGPEHWVGRLHGMLRMFAHHLKRHFALEESGEFLDVKSETPGVALVARHLRDQHTRFLEHLATLTVAAEQAEADRAELTDAFATDLEAFLQELREHEREENELVQKLVYHETGVGD